jgi:hypothetical protein
MTHWIRILGSILIALGIATFVLSALGGLGYWIWSMIQDQDYIMAVSTLGASFIIIGYALRKIFKEPEAKA